MNNNLILTIILLFIIVALTSSCCKYSKVFQKKCECKNYYAEIDNWFYYDKQLGKNFIKPDKQIEDVINFFRTNTNCLEDLSSKKMLTLFGGYPDVRNEKKIVFRFFAHYIDPNKKHKNPPISLIIKYRIAAIEESMYAMYEGADGYYEHEFIYYTKK